MSVCVVQWFDAVVRSAVTAVTVLGRRNAAIAGVSVDVMVENKLSVM